MLPIDTRALPGKGNIGAWESTGDNINNPAPRPAIKFDDIRKDGKPWKAAVRLPCRKDLLAILIDLDRADRGVAKEFVGEDSPAGSGE